jgi:hypothetical protein
MNQHYEEFRERVENAKRRLGVSVKNAWFRGQSHSWPLQSSLSRFLKGLGLDRGIFIDPREEDLFSEFMFRNDEYTLRTHTSWEILSVMQHYRVPTRLLDWSENFYTALYFAVAPHLVGEADPRHGPCIYITNPYELSSIALKTSYENPFPMRPQDTAKVWDVTLNRNLDYYETILTNKKWFFRTPLPIFSPWRNPRISAQRGFFTVEGHDSTPPESNILTKEEIKKIVIPKPAIEHIGSLLDDAGINHFTLFRDHESLSKLLIQKYTRSKPSKPSKV